jgi:hypothetical protein
LEIKVNHILACFIEKKEKIKREIVVLIRWEFANFENSKQSTQIDVKTKENRCCRCMTSSKIHKKKISNKIPVYMFVLLERLPIAMGIDTTRSNRSILSILFAEILYL